MKHDAMIPMAQAIRTRASAHRFIPDRPLPDSRLTSLVDLATQAPSAYHFQNWRFVAVRSQEAKHRLRAVAHGQSKVVEASAVFIVCGTLAPHTHLAKRLAPCVSTGSLDSVVAERWVTQAWAGYEDDPELQRDEAVRSASLAAMTLMLAAQGMGLATCPIGGFDAQALRREFRLGPEDIPVMLVAVGYPQDATQAPKPRRPVEELLEFV
jgi:putative NAD(P)H nitroreductase